MIRFKHKYLKISTCTETIFNLPFQNFKHEYNLKRRRKKGIYELCTLFNQFLLLKESESLLFTATAGYKLLCQCINDCNIIRYNKTGKKLRAPKYKTWK